MGNQGSDGCGNDESNTKNAEDGCSDDGKGNAPSRVSLMVTWIHFPDLDFGYRYAALPWIIVTGWLGNDGKHLLAVANNLQTGYSPS
jgi:hypothetical protein